MQVRRALLLATTLVVVAAATAGCTGGDQPRSAGTRSPSPTVTALAEVDLSGVSPLRAPFCSIVPEQPTEDLLGGAPSTTTSYVSGDRAAVTAGLADVVHEYSCTQARAGRVARSWVFASAIEPAEARRLVAERRRVPGCSPAGELRFGEPGVVQQCAGKGRRTVRLAGLFDGSWVTCQTTFPASAPAAAQLDASQGWCVAVLRAMATPAT